MAASYPSAAKSFTTKATSDTIAASHVNDLQDEVTAIEQALLTGGLAHNLFPSGTRTLGTSSAFWSKGYLAALILGAETTSGIRLEVNSGSLDVREGDDSGPAPMSASLGTFTTGIVAASANTASGTTGSIATATATTIFAASATGLFVITAYIADAGAATYTAAAYVLNDGTNARLVTISDGSALTITLSGTNVQVTQSSGGNAVVAWAYARVR